MPLFNMADPIRQTTIAGIRQAAQILLGREASDDAEAIEMARRWHTVSLGWTSHFRLWVEPMCDGRLPPRHIVLS